MRPRYDTIRDAILTCSKAHISQLNLPHRGYNEINNRYIHNRRKYEKLTSCYSNGTDSSIAAVAQIDSSYSSSGANAHPI